MTSGLQDVAGHGALPLFDTYPRLREGLVRLPIGWWPTPVTEARRFADAHGLGSLHVKREDRSHPQCGGNKVRGLEFLLAEARRRMVRRLLTVAAVGSYHIVCTACHAAPLGMKLTAVVLPQPATQRVGDNLLRGAEFGVEYVPVGHVTAVPVLVGKWVRQLLAPDRCCFIPPGGTSPLACVGHVNAAFELRRQIDAGLLPAPDLLFVALGSLGTAAGLALGVRLAGLETRVVGVVVAHRWHATARRLTRLSRRTLRLLQRHDPTVPNAAVRSGDVSVVTTALGEGYGHVLPEAGVMRDQMRELEGIELDDTYTAKALCGAFQFIRRHGLERRDHLFWHTCHAGERPADPSLQERLPQVCRAYVGG